MGQELGYDYQELAFDNYQAAHELLRDLVALRKHRHMTQSALADEMNVSQGYVSQIENGYVGLVDHLNDYAIEVGARISYRVEPAERLPQGRRYTKIQTHTGTDENSGIQESSWIEPANKTGIVISAGRGL